ncbi:hypothetical protein NDU88_005869 [Pleurodeles waltl]|uniref:Uncharacterized protein n=1 Tax=Pleurodeles waltl TaxID=8319 RepID=A0AAV7MC98_PLEWA|nr:hypothetical protein NDU88_005869 [Pleurodeles waltl]
MAPQTVSFRLLPGCRPPISGPPGVSGRCVGWGWQRGPGGAVGRPRLLYHRDSTMSGRPYPTAALSKAPQAMRRLQGSSSPPSASSRQAPTTRPSRHPGRVLHQVRACRSPELRRPWTLVGLALYNSAPPRGAAARDHGAPAAWPPPARSRWMPPDKLEKPGRTRSSLSSRLPSLLAWPCPPWSGWSINIFCGGVHAAPT